jgi:hypothetical protein
MTIRRRIDAAERRAAAIRPAEEYVPMAERIRQLAAQIDAGEVEVDPRIRALVASIEANTEDHRERA